VKVDITGSPDESHRVVGHTQREFRTCPVCGANYQVAGESDFCSVCLLRTALTEGNQPTELQNQSSKADDSFSEDEMPALPSQFENYELIIGEQGKAIELGRGAMGVTYKAIDTNLRRLVALKVISPRYTRHERTRERFVREARAAASLRHEHIASVYHLGFTGSICFYAMEYVEGQTLEQVLHSRGPLPEEMALQIASQVATALEAAHKQQLVHRDIKPANLIVSFDHRDRPAAKVIDFGLVKGIAGGLDESSVSEAGIVLGTPHYASPEQFSGERVDARSDIYSLGVTLWHMLTNTTPFRGSPAQVAGQHLYATLPIERLRHVSLPVVSLVGHLLEKDPKDRPQSAEELLALLNATMRSLVDLRHRLAVQKPKSSPRPAKARRRSYPGRGTDWKRAFEPWDFTPFLVEKFKGFIGREWLFREIDEWRSKDNPTALLIAGEPGIGKSAIIAALLYRTLEGQVAAYHCCWTDTPATLEPASFLRSVACMFAVRLEEYASMLECSSVIDSLRHSDIDPFSAFEAAILAPLHRIRRPEKRYYLVIDAIDEALARPHRPTIVDVLSMRVDRLPPWLSIIATTRNDPSVLGQLRSFRARVISAQDPRNQDDVRRFVRCRLREPIFRNKAKASHKTLARLEDDLLRASAGNFLFVRTALDAIEIGQLGFDHIENLPPGLSSLYEIFFRRLFPNLAKDFGPSRQVLETVVAAREPLTREQIAAATHLDPEEELPPILLHLASFVPPSLGRYALFHKSLFDWLTGWDMKQDQPFAGAYHLILQKGQARLADSCWAEYQVGCSQISLYCLRHLPAHLRQLGRDQLLSTLLGDFNFLQAKLESTDPSALIADYEGLPVKADLRRVQLSIELSAHVLARDCRQLAGQLIGRLLSDSAPAVQALLKGALAGKGWPWLRPLTQSLAPPGGPLIRTFEGHASWVHAVALTLDARYAISGSGDGTLRVWDLESNRLAYCFARHTGPIKAVAITRDGRRAVSASSDHTLRVWDLESGRLLRTLQGHCNPVSSVAITADGCRAVSAASDGILTVWDLQTGRSLSTLTAHTGSVNGVALTSDSHRAISASSDHTLRVWSVDSGSLVHTLEGHADSVNGIAVTPDNKLVVSASSDQTLRVWSIDSGNLLGVLEGHSDSVNAVAVSPDGHYALSASSDHTLRVWDLTNSRLVHRLEGHTNSVTMVTLSSDGCRALSGSSDHTLRLWDLKSGECVRTLVGHTDWVTAAAVTPDGKRALSGSADHTLRLWDLERKQLAPMLAGQTDNITRVFLTPDNSAAVTSDYHLLRVWDLKSGQLLHTLAGHTDWVTAAAVTPDGRHLISGSADHSLRLWNLEICESPQVLPGHNAIVTAVAIAPDGRRALSAAADRTLYIWDLETGRSLHKFVSEDGLVTAVALTPDCKCAVWGSNTGALLAWTSGRDEVVGIFAGNGQWITSVAVTGDGRYAILASGCRNLQVWDLRRREFIRSLEGHTDLVNAVVIPPDGHRAVSVSADHSTRVWNLESGDCIAAFSGEGPMLRCAIAPDGRTMVARDKSGRGYVLRLEGLE
jgi:WD40 repeat protein/serine/threonine protein kinase